MTDHQNKKSNQLRSIRWCRGLESVQFFVEGETECTSETARGQFSIFGAVEENVGRRTLRIAASENIF